MFFLLFITIKINSQSYYVSTQGNDSNPGTESLPFKTINNAINAMGSSGGTCIIREGYYHESVFIVIKIILLLKPFLTKKSLSMAPSQLKQLGLKVLIIQIFMKLL